MHRLLGLITVCLSLLFVATAAAAADFPDVSDPTDIVVGRPDAPVTIIEYGSVSCPPCANLNAAVIPTLKAKYIDTGEVRLIYRPMETGNPDVALAGHLLARCAGEKGFDVVQAVMGAQSEMDGEQRTEQYPNARRVLLRIAKTVGLNEVQFDQCLSDRKAIADMDTAHKAAIEGGVTGTPTVYINGKKLELTDFGMSDFDRALAPLLTKRQTH